MAAVGFGFATMVAAAEPVGLRAAVDDPPPAPMRSPLIGLARLELDGDPRIGGFSAILRLADPERLLLATDRGWLLTAAPTWGAEGALSGIEEPTVTRFPLPSGWSRDVEAMAVDGGELVVAVEGGAQHHVVRFEGLPNAPLRVVSARAVDDLGLAPNRGLEALVDLPGRGWLAIAEKASDGAFPALARDGRRWRYFGAPDHAPTAADRLGDRLFVLERKLSLLGGWQARIACLPVDDLDAGRLLAPQPLARLGVVDDIDNLEGIAVWRRGDDVEILLVSDDNFHPAQRSLVLHYRWPGGAVSGGCGAGANDEAKR